MCKLGFKALKPRVMVMERLLQPDDGTDEIYPSAQTRFILLHRCVLIC
jgi:hypothetical protein